MVRVIGASQAHINGCGDINASSAKAKGNRWINVLIKMEADVAGHPSLPASALIEKGSSASFARRNLSPLASVCRFHRGDPNSEPMRSRRLPSKDAGSEKQSHRRKAPAARATRRY